MDFSLFQLYLSKLRKKNPNIAQDKSAYRTQPCLVTNLVMNMVTNLVITKFGDELCDIFVTSFGDSLNWVMIFVTFLSLNLVGHQFE